VWAGVSSATIVHLQHDGRTGGYTWQLERELPLTQTHLVPAAAAAPNSKQQREAEHVPVNHGVVD
jgi:hypothetical protein